MLLRRSSVSVMNRQIPLRLSEKAHLPFGKPFDEPFDKLTVLSKVEGLMALSKGRRAALPSSLVTEAYFSVRLIPRDFGSLAYGHFPSTSREPGFSTPYCSMC